MAKVRDSVATLSIEGAILDVFNAVMRSYVGDMAQSRLRRLDPFVLLMGSVVAWSCTRATPSKAQGEAWVQVNQVPIGAPELQGVRQELAEYGRVRFSSEHAKNALVGSLIKLELLATQARDAGFFEEARVQWSLVETLAQKQARAIKERKVPRQSLQEDSAALAEFVNQDPGAFATPERRRAWIAVTKSWTQAQNLHDLLVSKKKDLETVEHAAVSEPMVRNDQHFPVFHRLLFDEELQAGEFLAGPVLVQGKPCVVRLEEVLEPKAVELGDPEQRARVVDAAIAAPQAGALTEYLETLQERWPLRRAGASEHPGE